MATDSRFERVQSQESPTAVLEERAPWTEPQVKPITPRQLVWRKFRNHKPALVGITLLLIMIGLAVSAPWIAKDPFQPVLSEIYERPSWDHPLGTDAIGRDYLARVLRGGRVSLQVGIYVALLSAAFGTLVGALSGYYRGVTDTLIMRLVDLMLSLPLIPILLVAGAIAGRSLGSMTIVLAVVLWAPLARIVRGSFLSLREREFVQAAQAAGASDLRIIFRHMLPNSVGPIVVFATLTAGTAILVESALSFLGLGIQPPTPSWGNLATDGKDVMFSRPWMLLPPGFAIVITVLAINFIGDGLRDALDPGQADVRIGQ